MATAGAGSTTTPTLSYRVIQPAPDSSSGNGGAAGNSSGDANGGAGPGGGGGGVQAVLASPINGQFYVIGNPADVLSSVSGVGGVGGGRALAPRPSPGAGTGGSAASSASYSVMAASTTAGLASSTAPPRDERRRATHNEVERRRRDNINTWINKLGKLIPDLCNPPNDGGTSGPPKWAQSKGYILSKACEYVVELRTENQDLLDKLNLQNQIVHENDRLHKVIEELKQELEAQRQVLGSHGLLNDVKDVQLLAENVRRSGSSGTAAPADARDDGPASTRDSLADRDNNAMHDVLS